MNARQRLLRVIHPVWNVFAKLSGKHSMTVVNAKNITPHQSFYDFSFSMADGSERGMRSFQGKKILIVNTASECVYTTQYSGLQELYEKFNDQLVIIAFPSNEFKEQEKGTDKQIAEFCSLTFGVKFPLAKKATVRKRSGQHPVFQWLTDPAKNGWNSRAPVWNFSKYLIDEKGNLSHIFGPPISPTSDGIVKAIKK